MRGRVGGIRQSRSPLGNIVATRRQCSSARGGECGLRKEAPAPLDRVNEDGGRNTAREGTCTVQGVPSELRLGFVDLDFECSTVFPTLLGLMGIWQKRLGKLVVHRNQSQPKPGLRSLGTPCIPCCFCCTVNQRYFEGSVDERGGIDFIHVPGTEGFYGSNPGTNCILMSVELGYSFGNLVRAVLL